MDLERGAILDNYKLLARVGAGSCGSVWQAENIVSGELEALKILSGGELAERELRALKLYREINHPALIRVRHIGRVDDTLFYTMDWCESSLAERKVKAEELLEIAKTLTEGLAALHSHGLLHRDIKPANIFFRQGSPVLGDIGLLTRLEGATFAGSPGFLSPSILSGKTTADCYSDCYALAKSIYCALSGMKPEQFPLYTGEMTPEASLLMRAVMAVCSDPYTIHSAEEFLHFLTVPPQKKQSHHVWLWICLAVMVAGSVAGCAYFLLRGHPQTVKQIPRKTESEVVTQEDLEKYDQEIEPYLKKLQEIKKAMSEPGPAPQTKSEKEETPQEKDQTREEIEKNFTALPLDEAAKLNRLQLDAEVARLIGSTAPLNITKKEESLLLAKLSPDQQKIYQDCCIRIQKINASPKWKKAEAEWKRKQFELKAQIRSLEEEKNMDAMSALQQISRQEPLLAFQVMQAKYQDAQKALINAAKQKNPPDFSPLINSLSVQTEECCKSFSSLKL